MLTEEAKIMSNQLQVPVADVKPISGSTGRGRVCKKAVFPSWDGTELAYRFWPAATDTDRALVVIHRGHEHSGRLQDLVEGLELPDYHAFGFDARGHGESPGRRGDADSFAAMVRDLDSFVQMIARRHGIPIEKVAVIANSVGAVVAATWVHDYAPKIRGMVLAAPAFRIKLYVPLAVPGLRLLSKLRPDAFIKSYVKPAMLTHDEAQAKAYAEDELITRDISVKILLGVHDAATRVVDDAGAIQTPCLLLSAGSDCVVQAADQRKFYQRLSSEVKEFRRLDGFYHSIFHEKERAKPMAMARDFVSKIFDSDATANGIEAVSRYTGGEFQKLKGPAAPLPKLSFGIQSLSMRTLGRLSEGIRLGLTTGFDSGQSLDYVYENRPRGITPIGKAIDRAYLEAIGWKGIRERKVNLIALLNESVDRLEAGGSAARIIDIAAGVGRYLLEIKKERGSAVELIQLRDYQRRNVDAAKALAERWALDAVHSEVVDAFDAKSYQGLAGRFNIAVISGLFELFPDNEPIERALAGVAAVLEDGGELIYTNQPWHPQVEMIARTLTNREGEPWIMRRRSQWEMDRLVEAHGFEKIETRVGPYGIFTVSVARKTSNTIER